jgi:hypothetical protein
MSANPDREADCHASGTVKAAAWAVLEHRDITLCGHCVGRHRARLQDQGWTIIPMTVTKPAAGVGTEATGQHYALTEES